MLLREWIIWQQDNELNSIKYPVAVNPLLVNFVLIIYYYSEINDIDRNLMNYLFKFYFAHCCYLGFKRKGED